jgi:hypothetical protein
VLRWLEVELWSDPLSGPSFHLSPLLVFHSPPFQHSLNTVAAATAVVEVSVAEVVSMVEVAVEASTAAPVAAAFLAARVEHTTAAAMKVAPGRLVLARAPIAVADRKLAAV